MYVPPIPYTHTYGPQFTLVLASGKEYALADSRWGTADPTVVSLEILTVFGVGTMCFYVLKQLVQRDPTRHYWIIVLSTSEIYGGCVFGLWTSPMRIDQRCGTMTHQLDDLLPGMAHGQPEPGHLERALPLGVPRRESRVSPFRTAHADDGASLRPVQFMNIM